MRWLFVIFASVTGLRSRGKGPFGETYPRTGVGYKPGVEGDDIMFDDLVL